MVLWPRLRTVLFGRQSWRQFGRLETCFPSVKPVRVNSRGLCTFYLHYWPMMDWPVPSHSLAESVVVVLVGLQSVIYTANILTKKTGKPREGLNNLTLRTEPGYLKYQPRGLHLHHQTAGHSVRPLPSPSLRPVVGRVWLHLPCRDDCCERRLTVCCY